MERVSAKKAYYEIEKLVGEGLTSQVYKAFRRDHSLLTRQPVALKILKSKNHIQALIQEFEKLLQFRSANCVSILACEQLSQGPALVLEYIDGVSLSQLLQYFPLSESQIDNLVCNVERGLNDLHSQSIVHGDLNLHNIMLDSKGNVKLIDFGYFNDERFHNITPEFADPRVLNGHAPDFEADCYALAKISKHLKKNAVVREIKSLGELVKMAQETNSQGTIVLQKPRLRVAKKLSSNLLAALLLPIFLLSFPSGKVSPTGELKVVSENWIEIFINGASVGFSPLHLQDLRAGKYSVTYQSAKEVEYKNITIEAGETFLLKP